MALQSNFSKGLAITWITEKPAKGQRRESSDFYLGETTWYLDMKSNSKLNDSKLNDSKLNDSKLKEDGKRYHILSLIEREGRKPEEPFTVMSFVGMNSRKRESPFGDSCELSSVETTVKRVEDTSQIIWYCAMRDITSKFSDFKDCTEMMVVCVFKDLPSSSTKESETQNDIEWPLNSHLPPALLRDVKCSKDITCELDDLSGDLSSLLEQLHFADLKLRCGESSFSVHRSILVARSGYFAKKLEVKSVENEPLTVDVSDVDADILELLLKFLYSGKIPDLNDEAALKLLAAGRMYAVRGLQKGCLEWMVRNLSKKNCVDFLAVSEEYGDDAFKNKVVSFIVSHSKVGKSHLKVAKGNS